MSDRSHRPQNIPKAHSEQELKLIKRLTKKHNWTDLILVYQELKEKYNYSRSYGGLKRIISKLKSKKAKKKTKRKTKLYKRANYIGQKGQIDVKFVPSYCVTNGKKYYEYIAVDECSRWAYRQMYEEHSTYSSYQFLLSLIKNVPFPIREVQTDNERKQLAIYQKKSNNYIKTCLNFQSLNQVVEKYLGVM